MKIPFLFDTAALISLGHTELINLIIDNFHIVVSKSIIDELKDISKFNDEDAKAANKWLEVVDRFEIKSVDKKEPAEDELFDICKKDDSILITDDIKAIRRFNDQIKCYYSVHVVYILFKKGIIPRERAWFSIGKMRRGRSWKSNIIAVTARILFSDDE